ncbi:MAG: hypothetical protein FJZ47_02590 [Candidatus Tectomicrobia bacterium]|uniref:Type I restriction enzyme R protein N-terminal domain-containing protein n=1 Tax=Tectimicrobiota bacterium TaxID=2528274 RepID=A0A937VYW8_UNCTE|nr:hypothetical protein [Candidatus Tectomicrobia bacterium]
MAYSDFTLDEIKKTFQIILHERVDLFAHIDELPVSACLRTILQQYVPLALAINTEKARSELMIAPLLVEFRTLTNNDISLFSGVPFNVDTGLGLNGVCDFIVCYAPEQLYITAPAIIVVEAKNENIIAGFPQCIATMLAARIFNARHGQSLDTIYGVVTTGNIWKFLRLESHTVYIDSAEYYIATPGKILGILASIVPQQAAAGAAS